MQGEKLALRRLPAMNGTPLHVLLVDADGTDATLLRSQLAELPAAIDVRWAESFEIGLDRMLAERYDVHLVAGRLGARSGVDLIRAYRDAGGLGPALLLAEEGAADGDFAALEAGAAGYIVRAHADGESLKRAIRYTAAESRRTAAVRKVREELEIRVAERTDALEALNRALGAEVAERLRAEHALRDANRRKDEFLATLAHELRNPLAPIASATEILARLGESDEERVRGTNARLVIGRQVAHLVRLIDDLLDLSRFTHGKLEMRREWVTVASVVESALETVRPLLAARRHALELILPDESLPLHGDPMRIAQVLTNLLSNAAKYTEPGGRIRVEASREQDQIVITVADSGIGIRQDHLAHVFTMFGQGQKARDAVHGGLGVGLALAKRVVEMHGGSLTASSDGEGLGSVFILRFPPGPGNPLAESGPESAAAQPVRQRILVVDDNVDAALTLAELLELDGHETHVAHDGPAAVEAARSLRPQIVVLDLGLPGFDGLEAARRIRARPDLTGILLIALSGLVQPEDRARSRAAGFDHHLAKPVNVRSLQSLLASHSAGLPA
ncbi:MAG: ATP-binding protein [Thermoanaerobaculia bacterium]